VRASAGELEAAGSPSPFAEARVLVAAVLGVEPSLLITAPDLTEQQEAVLTSWVARRAAGEPLQHLTGVAHFRTVSLEVGPGVFIPRPETEVMTGWAVEWLKAHPGSRVVELCAGSGAVSLALATELSGLDHYACEIDPVAAAYAQRNLLGSGVQLWVGDMVDAFAELDGSVDLVIANPPYIPLTAWESVAPDVRDFDPQVALFSGEDGLDAMRVVARVAARLLRPGGVVLAEHAEVQHEAAAAVFVRSGRYQQVRDHQDLTRRWRFVAAVRSGVAG
jgi:release factor glutamine methyltransferase